MRKFILAVILTLGLSVPAKACDFGMVRGFCGGMQFQSSYSFQPSFNFQAYNTQLVTTQFVPVTTFFQFQPAFQFQFDVPIFRERAFFNQSMFRQQAFFNQSMFNAPYMPYPRADFLRRDHFLLPFRRNVARSLRGW